tara:strand:- start:1 stop:333 length:333 start_codon:yes stop_codon:yes gene_type:complete
MTYLIIADADENNKPTKANVKETKAEADAVVDKIKATGNTKVFAVETSHAKKDIQYIRVNFSNKTVSYDQTAEDEDTAAEELKVSNKASGKTKLKDLGLNDDEIKALIGA